MFGSKSYSCFVLTTEVDGKPVEQMLNVRSFDVGRSFDATLQFSDPSISKVHARFSQRQGHVYLEDLGSRNGTYVDGKRLELRATIQLTDKSKVFLGQSPIVLTVRLIKKVVIKSVIEQEKLQAGDKVKVLDIIEAARIEAKRTIDLAQQRSMESEREALARHQEKIESATNQAEQLVSHALEESKKMVDDATAHAHHIAVQGTEARDQILSEAKNIAKELQEEAVKQIREINQETLKKTQEAEEERNLIVADLEQKKAELNELTLNKQAQEIDLREWEKVREETKAQTLRVEDELREQVGVHETAFYEVYSQLLYRLSQTEIEAEFLEAQALQKQSDLDSLEEKIADSGKKLEDSLKKFADHLHEVGNLKSTRENLESSIQDLKTRLAQDEQEHRRKVQDLQANLDIETQRHVGQLELFKREKENLQDGLTQAKSMFASEKSQMATLKLEEELELERYRHHVKSEKQKEDSDLATYKDQMNLQRQHEISELGKCKSQLQHQKQKDQLEIEQFREELKKQQQQSLVEFEAFKAQLNTSKEKENLDLAYFREELKRQKQQDLADIPKYKEQIKAQKQEALDELNKYREQIKAQKQEALDDVAKYKDVLKNQKQDALDDLNRYKDQLRGQKQQDQLELAHFREDIKHQKNQEQVSLQQTKDQFKVLKQQSVAEMSLFEDQLKSQKQEKVSHIQKELEALQGDSMRQHLLYKNELSARIDRFSGELTKDVLSEVELLTGHLFQAKEATRIGDAINKWLSKSGESGSNQKPSLDVDIPKSAARAGLKYTAYGWVSGAAMMVAAAYFFSYYYDIDVELKTNHKQEVVVAPPKVYFHPEQTPDLRETLAESVLFTQGYSELYLDKNFQNKWRKKVSEYLLRQWRIPEEKSIQIISLQLALIEGIENQKKSIEADKADKDIEKLKEFEEDNLKDLKAILGTKSKYEAYRNFDREFFKQEQQARTPASQ